MNKNFEFVERFIQACGTSEVAKITRLLNIPYQTVRNYLGGRLPQTDKLIMIAERTSCSIDWLLTGKGKKFPLDRTAANTPVSTGQFRESVREICVEVINEINGKQKNAQPKVVILRSNELLSEKVLDEADKLAKRRR